MVTPARRVKVDVLFRRYRVAVFVDGCFWHGCAEHMTWPKANADWWRAKIARNTERDDQIDQELTAAGWTVIRAWEHEDPGEVADRVSRALSAAAQSSRRSLRAPSTSGTAP